MGGWWRGGGGGGGTEPSFRFFLKTAGHSRLCGRGHCHGARTNPHSATSLDVFVAGSNAIVSPHSSKTADILFVLDEQTPCAKSHQHKKNQQCLRYWSELAALFLVWGNLVTSTDLIAALTQGRSRAPTLITCYDFCEKLRVILSSSCKLANIHTLVVLPVCEQMQHEFCSNPFHHQIFH